jgi:hypothetical protein
LLNTLMKSLGDSSLSKSVAPTADGGGQVSKDGTSQETLGMVGQLMDTYPETFGTPGQGGGGTSGSGDTPKV